MSTGNIIFWIVVIAIGGYFYLRRKGKIRRIAGGNKTPVIDDENIVEKWSQLLIGMGGKGEELLKSIARKLQELNLPNVTLLRKEASLGKSDYSQNKHEFVSIRHHRYPDYEFFIGAIDRAGQLRVSWYLTVRLLGKVTATLRAANRASRDSMPAPMRAFSLLPRKLGKMAAQKLNERATGSPGVIRVRPEDMTLDDREELGTYIMLVHKAVLEAVEEIMNELNLDFTKIDKRTEGFLNLS